MIAWRRLEDVPSEPVPWLLGTARRVLANHRRFMERRSRNGSAIPLDYVDLGDPSTSPFELIAERQAFTAAFAAVSAEDREVLALIAWEASLPLKRPKSLAARRLPSLSAFTAPGVGC